MGAPKAKAVVYAALHAGQARLQSSGRGLAAWRDRDKAPHGKPVAQGWLYTSAMSGNSLPSSVSKRLSLGGIAILAASLLLHLLLLQWIKDGSLFSLGSNADAQPVVVQLKAELKTTEALAPVPAPPIAQERKPRPQRAKPPTAPAQLADQLPEPQNTAGAVADGQAASTPALSDLMADMPAHGQAEPPAPTMPADLEPYRLQPPPSAMLRYAVQATRDGGSFHGNGRITWRSDGSNYSVVGEAKLLFIPVLDFSSNGSIDDYGVAPVIYTEKRFRKPATNTHFHRERKQISFSASTLTYPRSGGEQDRASIIWQLASIGRGDGDRLVPGLEIELFVAGVRDAEPWLIRVIGQEQIEVDGKPLRTLHLLRLPRPGSYGQKLDIWLAPAVEWYPVKLRFTETNGDYLDLSLSELPTRLPPTLPTLPPQ